MIDFNEKIPAKKDEVLQVFRNKPKIQKK